MKNLHIKKGQYLKDILSAIPSNAIIYKNLTGIGATTLELETERHSIIIEPNVPVIINKCKKHPNVLGVYKGISEKMVLEYLNDDSIPYKKIITTPESFSKIDMVGIESSYNLSKEFFLLFDECDKVTTDLDYRESILSPMFHFFYFENKAFVSATAITPSDPRFKEQGFEEISIIPDFDIKKPINLYTTNNPYELLLKLFKKDDKKPKFIFFNSTRGIEKLISFLKIKDESAIFCSDKALDNLASSVSAYDQIDETKFEKYNFFTCRFFSAVDIDIDYDCEIYIVTDLNVAKHSTIDPCSDAIQIIGRFRNQSVKTEVNIISNTDPNLNCKNVEDANMFLKCAEHMYKTIYNYSRTTKQKAIKDVLDLTLKTLPFNEFLDENGNKCHFRYDNFIFHNRVASYYLSENELVTAYKNSGIKGAKMYYFDITYRNQLYYMSSDDVIRGGIFKRYLTRIHEFKNLIKRMDDSALDEDNQRLYKSVFDSFKLYYAELIEVHDLGLLDRLNECHSKKDVDYMLKKHKMEMDRNDMAFIEELRLEFPKNSEWTGEQFRQKFKELIEKHGLSISSTIREGRNFMEISDRERGKGKNREKYFYKILLHN